MKGHRTGLHAACVFGAWWALTNDGGGWGLALGGLASLALGFAEFDVRRRFSLPLAWGLTLVALLVMGIAGGFELGVGVGLMLAVVSVLLAVSMYLPHPDAPATHGGSAWAVVLGIGGAVVVLGWLPGVWRWGSALAVNEPLSPTGLALRISGVVVVVALVIVGRWFSSWVRGSTSVDRSPEG